MGTKLHQFDYIFAISVIFAFLDAWNIGANDVANSFASSISSRSLKYWQAMVLAAIMEFLGAVLAGSRVSDTIKSKIIDIDTFKDEPAVLMITMACALVGSSLWLSAATSFGLPCSTTHSIVGAVIGSGIAAVGAKNIHWGWGGFASIVASWFIAPVIAGCFAAIIFLFSKYTILERKNGVRNVLYVAPIFVFITLAILTMLIVWKGAPNLKLDKLSTGAIVGSIFGVAGVGVVLYFVFLFPYFRRRLVHKDWTLRWYHAFIGFMYYFKPTDDITPVPEGHNLVPDYYAGKRDSDYDKYGNSNNTDEEVAVEIEDKDDSVVKQVTGESSAAPKHESELAKKIPTKELWLSMLKHPNQWPKLVWLILIHGFTQDVITSQVDTQGSMLSGDLRGMHARAKYYDNELEYCFSLLQAVTACTMSFAHGSNDIANAAGPLSTVYTVWTTNAASKKADVPIWVLCFTAGSLVLGAWTYGYNIMRNLGNRLTLQSPARGFSIELGAAITTVMASQLAIPVSTTQEAVGATVFVGLCNKDLKSVNWRMVLFIYMGWILTLPCAGIVAGILNGIILNAPNFGEQYEMT